MPHRSDQLTSLNGRLKSALNYTAPSSRWTSNPYMFIFWDKVNKYHKDVHFLLLLCVYVQYWTTAFPKYWWRCRYSEKTSQASRALAGVNSNIQRLPNPYMLINTIALQEAKASSAIENIFTTEDELYKAVSDTIKEKNANPATKEVLRYREALWEGYKRILFQMGMVVQGKY